MKLLNIALAVFLLLSLHVQPYQGSRILHEELHGKLGGLQSLQRGSVPGSSSSGCTNIPGTGGPSCPNVNSMNFAGNALPHSGGAYPRLVVEFGVATNQKPS